MIFVLQAGILRQAGLPASVLLICDYVVIIGCVADAGLAANLLEL